MTNHIHEEMMHYKDNSDQNINSSVFANAIPLNTLCTANQYWYICVAALRMTIFVLTACVALLYCARRCIIVNEFGHVEMKQIRVLLVVGFCCCSIVTDLVMILLFQSLKHYQNGTVNEPTMIAFLFCLLCRVLFLFLLNLHYYLVKFAFYYHFRHILATVILTPVCGAILLLCLFSLVESRAHFYEHWKISFYVIILFAISVVLFLVILANYLTVDLGAIEIDSNQSEIVHQARYRKNHILVYLLEFGWIFLFVVSFGPISDYLTLGFMTFKFVQCQYEIYCDKQESTQTNVESYSRANNPPEVEENDETEPLLSI